MKVYMAEKKIELSKIEAKAAETVGSATYNKLQMARRDYPDFEVCVKIKKPTGIKSPKIKAIQKYVDDHGTDIQKKVLSILRGENPRGEKASYFAILSWFYSEFPEYKKSFDDFCSEAAKIDNSNDIVESAPSNDESEDEAVVDINAAVAEKASGF